MRGAIFITLFWMSPLLWAKPKVVALAPHLVELVYEVGAGEQLIGVMQHSDFPEQATALPVVGSYLGLQLEVIVDLNPDIVLAWDGGNPEADLQRLTQLGYRVVRFNPKRLEDIATDIVRIGALTGQQQQASTVAKKFGEKLQQIRYRYRDKAYLTAFYEIWGNPLTSIGDGSWPVVQLAVCNARSVTSGASGSYPQVNIEQVLAKRVDVIIQPTSPGSEGQVLFDWQRWQQVKAVKHGQIIKPNADKLHRMSSRVLAELDSLCAEIDKARSFYSNLDL